MGKEWREARDARVKRLKEQQSRCIYGQWPQQSFIVDSIKAPLLANIQLIRTGTAKEKVKAALGLRQVAKDFRKLPVPTVENTWHPNSHKLIEVRDSISRKYFLGSNSLFNLGADFLIVMYDYDPPYRDMADDVYEQLRSRPWGVESLALVRDWYMKKSGLSGDRKGFIDYGFNLLIRNKVLRNIAGAAFEMLPNKMWLPKGAMNLIGHNWDFWKSDEN
jgi:hypothetical protein